MKFAILKDKEIVRFEDGESISSLSLGEGEYPYACHKANFQIGDRIYLPQDDLRDFIMKKPRYNLWRKVGHLYIIGSSILATATALYYFLIYKGV